MESIMGERIRKLLQGNPITKAAKEMEITQSLLSDIINGKKKQGISSSTLRTMCTYFNVSADYLLGLTDNATVDPELQAVCKYTGLSQAAAEILHGYVTGLGVYKEVFDLDEAKHTGADYLQVISSLIDNPDSKNIWRQAALSIKIDRQKSDPRKEKLDMLLEKYGLETITHITSSLDDFILSKDNAAKFFRQDAADTLKKILETLGGKQDGIDTATDDEEW